MPDSRIGKYILVLIITAARIPFAIVFSLVFLLNGYEKIGLADGKLFFTIICVVLLVLGELTDLFDGMMARKLNVVSETGAMLDPYADSISRIIIYWSLACAGLVTPLVPLVMAFRDISVSYSRVILSKAGKSVSAKWSGKIKAAVQGVGSVTLVLQPVMWSWGLGNWTIQAGSWIIIIVTLASMIEYSISALKEMGSLADQIGE